VIVSQLFLQAALIAIGLINWYTVNKPILVNKQLYDFIAMTENPGFLKPGMNVIRLLHEHKATAFRPCVHY
jgi:hypothetical protein